MATHELILALSADSRSAIGGAGRQGVSGWRVASWNFVM